MESGGWQLLQPKYSDVLKEVLELFIEQYPNNWPPFLAGRDVMSKSVVKIYI